MGILFFDTSHECHTSVTGYLVSVVCYKTAFTFLCSKDFLRITDGVDKIFGLYCGNKAAGKNLHVTGDRVQLIFRSDGEIERRGYLLNFTLVSLSSSSVFSGKWDHKEADKTWRVLLPRGESRGKGAGDVHPSLPEKKSSSTYPDLRFFYLTSQLLCSLLRHPLLRKTLDPPASLPGRLLGRLPSLIVSTSLVRDDVSWVW